MMILETLYRVLRFLSTRRYLRGWLLEPVVRLNRWLLLRSVAYRNARAMVTMKDERRRLQPPKGTRRIKPPVGGKGVLTVWQLWVQNDKHEFEKIGPPKSDVDGNLWLQVLGRHFGSEVRLRPIAKVVMPVIISASQSPLGTGTTRWPGEE